MKVYVCIPSSSFNPKSVDLFKMISQIIQKRNEGGIVVAKVHFKKSTYFAHYNLGTYHTDILPSKNGTR